MKKLSEEEKNTLKLKYGENYDKVNDVKLLISVDQVKNGFVLRKGKKNFKKVEMK